LRINVLSDFRRSSEYRNRVKEMAVPMYQTEVRVVLYIVSKPD
jgi:hypothetical protein